MKFPVPDLTWAKPMLEAYQEDGVQGKVEYDPDTAQWFVNLDDKDYKEYQVNLKKRHDEVCKIVRLQAEKWQKESNAQFIEVEPPSKEQTRLTMYLTDPDCGTAKAFKITGSIREILERKYVATGYGSWCESCGKRTMVILIWEDVKPKR